MNVQKEYLNMAVEAILEAELMQQNDFFRGAVSRAYFYEVI